MPDDYDEWERAGCAGWGWTDVQTAFVRLEADQGFADRAYHGGSGPLPIEPAL